MTNTYNNTVSYPYAYGHLETSDSPENSAEVGIDVQCLVRPCCANCRWGMELEHRYDHVHCINEDSEEAFGDVEATFTCQLFEANTK